MRFNNRAHFVYLHKYEHNRKLYFPNSQLSHILLHSPKRNISNSLTDDNILTKL